MLHVLQVVLCKEPQRDGITGSDPALRFKLFVRNVSKRMGDVTVVQPPPKWMSDRPDARLQVVRGGRAYAVLPFGAQNVACTQKVEIVATDGSSCGSTDYPIAAGSCNTGDLEMAVDGTVIQQLPASMETVTDPFRAWHTCTWRFWSRAAH